MCFPPDYVLVRVENVFFLHNAAFTLVRVICPDLHFCDFFLSLIALNTEVIC